MSDNRTDEPIIPHEIIQIIYLDVREIKALLNGSNGLVARVKVLEAAEESKKWHFGLIWSALVGLALTIIGWWRHV